MESPGSPSYATVSPDVVMVVWRTALRNIVVVVVDYDYHAGSDGGTSMTYSVVLLVVKQNTCE